MLKSHGFRTKDTKLESNKSEGCPQRILTDLKYLLRHVPPFIVKFHGRLQFRDMIKDTMELK